MPGKRWVTSITELSGKVYVSVEDSNGSYIDPLVYDSDKDQWAILPPLPCAKFSLVAVHNMKQLLAIGGYTKRSGVISLFNSVFLWNGIDSWLTTYPDMPTKRCHCTSVSYQSVVIVVGGTTSFDPYTLTRVVEVLHINDGNLASSQWSVVERLPHVVCKSVPLLVDNQLYIATGTDNEVGFTTVSVVAASLPELLQSNNATNTGQVWNKLPDMPYCSYSLNHYQGHLITFTGDYLTEEPDDDDPVYKLTPHIHMYNPDTKFWDYVGDVPNAYYMGRSVHILENKFLFIGGLSGKHDTSNDDMVKTCTLLTIYKK